LSCQPPKKKAVLGGFERVSLVYLTELEESHPIQMLSGKRPIAFGIGIADSFAGML
jgi:hypothetical protein